MENRTKMYVEMDVHKDTVTIAVLAEGSLEPARSGLDRSPEPPVDRVRGPSARMKCEGHLHRNQYTPDPRPTRPGSSQLPTNPNSCRSGHALTGVYQEDSTSKRTLDDLHLSL